MTNNSLQLAISELQKSDRVGPVSWSSLASNLLHLLKLYSSGLSLPVVVDQLTHPSHTVSGANHLHSASLIGTLQNPPVWLLSLPGDRLHAHIPHSLLQNLCLPSGVRLTIPLHQHLVHNSPCETPAYVDTLSAINHILRAANCKLVNKTTVSTLPSSLSFPSTPVWFHIDSFPLHRLQLPLPIESYTLHRLWDEGSLYPTAVYASILNVEPDTGMARLQDKHPTLTPNRVIRCHFSSNHAPLLRGLRPTHSLLIMAPGVHPTEDSFTLSVAEQSLCLFSEQSGLSPQSIYLPAADVDKTADHRLIKRQRIDMTLNSSCLTSCTTPVTASVLSSMSSALFDNDCKLTVHARLSEPPSMCSELNLCSHFAFSDGPTRIRVPRSKCRAEYRVGDELLFNGVRRMKHYWIANQVENISTMTAILLAPFTIRFVNGQEIKERIASKALASTAHVCVSIHSAQIMHHTQDILLKVTDWESDCQLIKREIWEVSMSDRCFDVLFGIKDASELWDGDEDYTTDIITNNESSLKHGPWRMTLTCDGSISLFPKLCACVNISHV